MLLSLLCIPVRVGDVPVSLPDALRILLPVANDWQTIGTLMGIAPDVLENIRTREKEVPINCLRAMLGKMIKLTDPSPTWKALAEAVEPIDPDKAKEIQDSYRVGGGELLTSPAAWSNYLLSCCKLSHVFLR